MQMGVSRTEAGRGLAHSERQTTRFDDEENVLKVLRMCNSKNRKYSDRIRVAGVRGM